MNLCEITLRKDQTPQGQKRPDILNRKIEVPELKSSVRLNISVAGLEALKAAGGITKFLTDREENKLSPKLKKIKAKLVAAGKIKIKEPEPERPEGEVASESSAEAAPEEAAKAEEAPAEEAKEEAPAEAPQGDA